MMNKQIKLRDNLILSISVILIYIFFISVFVYFAYILPPCNNVYSKSINEAIKNLTRVYFYPGNYLLYRINIYNYFLIAIFVICFFKNLFINKKAALYLLLLSPFLYYLSILLLVLLYFIEAFACFFIEFDETYKFSYFYLIPVGISFTLIIMDYVKLKNKNIKKIVFVITVILSSFILSLPFHFIYIRYKHNIYCGNDTHIDYNFEGFPNKVFHVMILFIIFAVIIHVTSYLLIKKSKNMAKKER